MSDYEQPSTADLTRISLGLRSEAEPPSFGELVGEDIPDDQLAELWLSAVDYQRAAKAVVDALVAELGTRMKTTDTAIQVGETLVFYKARISSRIVDNDGFWEWMKKNPDLMEAAFNPNSIRKTGIPASVLDTFYEKVEKPNAEVQQVPVHVIERNKKGKQ